MINSYLRHRDQKIFRHAIGAATLIFAVVLLALSTLIIIFAANFGRMQTFTAANLYRKSQAFYAAEAGIEHGLAYMDINFDTIIAAPVAGFINYTHASITNVTQNNGSTYSVSYTNPIANNYNLILITSTGFSDDNSASEVSTQLVQRGSLLSNYGNHALVSKGSVTLSGNADITNLNTNQTIQSASTISFGGSSRTIVTTGTGSNSAGTGPDIQQNQTSLANMSQDDFFASYFGGAPSTVQPQFAHQYTNSSDTNYSSTLAGMSGTSIWINQTGGSTASISGNTVIGTATSPVLLVVNGSLSISGNVTVNGFIFVIGTSGYTTVTGSLAINGGLATSDNLSMSGSSSLIFNPTILNNLQNSPSMRYFARVAGGWKDF